PLRELNPAVPRRIAELLDRCLSLDPKARPAGTRALVAALRRQRQRLLQPADQRFAHAIDAHIRQAGVKHGQWRDYAGRGRAKMLLGDFGEDYQTCFTEAQSLFLEVNQILANLRADERPP